MKNLLRAKFNIYSMQTHLVAFSVVSHRVAEDRI